MSKPHQTIFLSIISSFFKFKNVKLSGPLPHKLQWVSSWFFYVRKLHSYCPWFFSKRQGVKIQSASSSYIVPHKAFETFSPQWLATEDQFWTRGHPYSTLILIQCLFTWPFTCNSILPFRTDRCCFEWSWLLSRLKSLMQLLTYSE